MGTSSVTYLSWKLTPFLWILLYIYLIGLNKLLPSSVTLSMVSCTSTTLPSSSPWPASSQVQDMRAIPTFMNPRSREDHANTISVTESTGWNPVRHPEDPIDSIFVPPEPISTDYYQINRVWVIDSWWSWCDANMTKNSEIINPQKLDRMDDSIHDFGGTEPV